MTADVVRELVFTSHSKLLKYILNQKTFYGEVKDKTYSNPFMPSHSLDVPVISKYM